jgi:hypothetical protein
MAVVVLVGCFLLAFGRAKVRAKHAWKTGRQQVKAFSFFWG